MPRHPFASAPAAALLLAAAAAAAHAQTGPDVIVGELQHCGNWGAAGPIRAYSVATTSCNIGTEDLLWIAGNNQHPVIAQNMYRLHNGRFVQLGQSWLKHAFTAVNNGICGTCNGHLGTVLGVGCSDPYNAALNGEQARLGPRSDVNASTGEYPYPYTIAWQQSGNIIYKRLQVLDAELHVEGALYFCEGHYVTRDDADAGNQMNNASYRRITIAANGNATIRDTTRRTIPAIFAWRDYGNGIDMPPDDSVVIKTIDVPNDGRFFVAAKVIDNNDGTWNYEYAVQNLNSHRSAAMLTITHAPGPAITNIGFRDVPYHSGEIYTQVPWVHDADATEVRWAIATDDLNPNALRWGTMYNFWFTADSPPEDGSATLTLLRPGEPSTLSCVIPVPSAGGNPCPADCNDSGFVDAADVGCFLTLYFQDIAKGTTLADCDGNGTTTSADVGCFLTLYFDAIGPCP